MLIAKPVINKQFWILQDGNQNVGNVEACAGGYQVKINNQITQYKTIRMLAQRINVKFEDPVAKVKTQRAIEVHGYPAKGRVCNPIWDVKMKLPIYTKTNKSKSWFAAGWYMIKKGRSWTMLQDPKLIMLQRYAYQGPYYSQQQANDTHTKIC
jgi:hypothetical protein